MGIRALLVACTLLALPSPSSPQRVVTVQPGPLVRTEGSHVTILCNVTGYRSLGVAQDFEWSMYLSSAPDREIRVVSTAQPGYAYAVYAARVVAKEIWVERLGRDSALLHLARVEARDQGLFECYTPNTDGVYLGSYSARTNLTVIPDSLSVSSPAQTLSRVEGDSLQLSCEASEATPQHTHLSVGWYLRSAEDAAAPPQEVLALSRDFVLRAGPAHRQRVAAGDLRLDKTTSTAYRLTVHKLQPADQGLWYCQATEWVQDADGSWFAMTRKQGDATQLRVQPADRDFSITVTAERRSFTAGEPLDLRCAIEAQGVAERFFSVSWVFSSTPLAVVGPGAVPVLGGEYAAREAAGGLTVRKEAPGVHLLRLQRLRPDDAGKYICRVTERERTPTGDFIDRSKRSRNVQITVQPVKSNLTVSLSINASEVQEGDTILLTCSARSASGALSVAWDWSDPAGAEGAGPEPEPEPIARELARVERDGTVVYGARYRERAGYGEVRAERAGRDAYTLALYAVAGGDRGTYRCTVTEWIRPQGEGPEDDDAIWEKVAERSAAKGVNVKTVESSFVVSASSRTPSVSFGDSFDLQCLVKPRHNPLAPASVTWRFQPSADSASAGSEGAGFRDLVTFTRDGTLQWGETQLLGPGTRTNVDRSHANTNFRLSVARAGRREAGTYQCSAQLWRRSYDRTWTRVANRTSNPLGITVLQPVSNLRVEKSNRSLAVPEDGRVRLNCSLLSQTGPDPQHAVLWYVRRHGNRDGHHADQPDDELLLRVERGGGVFRYGAYADEERLRRRLQSERGPSPRQHALTLSGAEGGDSGAYYCVVEEWLCDPDGAWYRLGSDASGLTRVEVRRPEVRLQVVEAESNVTVQEGGAIRLGCSVPSQSSRDSRFSVSWYVRRSSSSSSSSSSSGPRQPPQDDEEEEEEEEEEEAGLVGGEGEEPGRECVFSIGHDAVFGNGNCRMAEEGEGAESRLQFQRTTSDLYSLTIRGALPSDRGRYHCHVEEWLLNPRNAWYRLATNDSGVTVVNVLQRVSLQAVVCSNDSLFYFVFFYPFPVFGILLIAVLLARYKGRGAAKSAEGKNGAPLLWIKEPHLSYSPTCLDPPVLSLHPGSVE